MIAERHVFQGELASGGFGRVFLARDEFLGREVAIKRLRHDGQSSQYFERKQLLHEAKVLAAVQHPNIVTIYDVDTVKGATEIVMEYVPGVTVRQLVKRQLVTAYDFRVLAKQMLCGLSAAHEHEVLHCDIKPSNVMISSVSESRILVKLLDFGMSPSSCSSKQQLVGSAMFMAPEIYEGKPHSKQTDLYSMGCLFYYMLTGVVPFDGEDTIQVMAAHCGGDYHPLVSLREDLPEDLCTWVELFMSARPDMRFASCDEALEELGAIHLPSCGGEKLIEIAEGVCRRVKPITMKSLMPERQMGKAPDTGAVSPSEMLLTRKISSAVCDYAKREARRAPVYRMKQGEVAPPKKIEACELDNYTRRDHWYVMLDGRRRGPLELDSLGRLILGGYVGCEDQVWHEGWNDWRRADECTQTGVYLCEYKRLHPDPVVEEEKVVADHGGLNWELAAVSLFGLLAMASVYANPQHWVMVMAVYACLLALGGVLSLKFSEGKAGRKWLVRGLLMPVVGDVYYACRHKRQAVKGITLVLLGGVFFSVAMMCGTWDWRVLYSLAP